MTTQSPAQMPSPSEPTDTGDDPRRAPDLLVEAALFSAGQPMSMDELVETTKLQRPAIQDSLESLQEAWAERRTSLAIVRSGTKWALALKPRFADEARHIVPPEIPLHVLRTLALVAYHQPLLQSDLKEMVGSKVYEHVGILTEAGLVRRKPSGLTYELNTTQDFPEYFGIPADQAEEIRTFLAEKVGLLNEGGAPQVGEGEPSVPLMPPVPGDDTA